MTDEEMLAALDATSAEEFLIAGTSIVSVKTAPHRTSVVCFQPSHATLNAFGLKSRFFSAEGDLGQDVNLSVEDTNGMFTPNRPQRLVSYLYEPGNRTLIVCTEDQV